MTTDRLIVTALAVAGLCVCAPPANAHHSGAGFNNDKLIEITGTIKEFQFKNPHTWIQIMVDNDKGEKMEWSLEWGSPNSLGRQGIRPSTFPPGARAPCGCTRCSTELRQAPSSVRNSATARRWAVGRNDGRNDRRALAVARRLRLTDEPRARNVMLVLPDSVTGAILPSRNSTAELAKTAEKLLRFPRRSRRPRRYIAPSPMSLRAPGARG